MQELIKEINPERAADGSLGFKIGHSQDNDAKTGVTVIYFPSGAKVGCDISGGGPASRETPLTLPETADNPVNAIVLSGGSAYGLAASDGVMRCLEDNNIGFNTGSALVPLVCQSCIYDLSYGSSRVRPNADMGYEACQNALGLNKTAPDSDKTVPDSDKTAQGLDKTALKANGFELMGNVGAGTGATVGKIKGMKLAQKSGLGIHSVSIGGFVMTAVVAVNALGDIINPENGKKIAGLHTPDRKAFDDTRLTIYKSLAPKNLFTGNTTIGAIITNGLFSKAEMNKIASMAANAYARCIYPVGTMADGDTVYAASAPAPEFIRDNEENACGGGFVRVDINAAGTLAADVMAQAIIKAVKTSQISDEEYLSAIN